MKILLGTLCGEVCAAAAAVIFERKKMSVQSLLHVNYKCAPMGLDDGFFLTRHSSALRDAVTGCIVFCHLPNPRRAPMPLDLQECVGHMGVLDLPARR